MVYRDGKNERKVVFSAERPKAVVAATVKAKGTGARIAVEDEAELEAVAEEEAIAERERRRA